MCVYLVHVLLNYFGVLAMAFFFSMSCVVDVVFVNRGWHLLVCREWVEVDLAAPRFLGVGRIGGHLV